MKIDYLVCNDVRPMQKLDTYSFIMDFRGGTYCSQVRANSTEAALREWLKLIRAQQDEIKFLTGVAKLCSKR